MDSTLYVMHHARADGAHGAVGTPRSRSLPRNSSHRAALRWHEVGEQCQPEPAGNACELGAGYSDSLGSSETASRTMRAGCAGSAGAATTLPLFDASTDSPLVETICTARVDCVGASTVFETQPESRTSSAASFIGRSPRRSRCRKKAGSTPGSPGSLDARTIDTPTREGTTRRHRDSRAPAVALRTRSMCATGRRSESVLLRSTRHTTRFRSSSRRPVRRRATSAGQAVDRARESTPRRRSSAASR